MAKKHEPKNLIELVKVIGKLTHTVDNDGKSITKDECLIRLLWDTALGYTERTLDDKGVEKEIKHKPQRWAMQEIISRREGGIPAAASDVGQRMTAAKQVQDLVKDRLNSLVETTDA
jgi:hypothetical protein